MQDPPKVLKESKGLQGKKNNQKLSIIERIKSPT